MQKMTNNVIEAGMKILIITIAFALLPSLCGQVNRRDVLERYDLAIYGATPSGIACAVRAAREGLDVLLVNRTSHIGGFMTSGAGGWEAPYDGWRSELYNEILNRITQYYIDRYGEGSPQHLNSMPSKDFGGHLGRPKVEPRVAEIIFNQMVESEERITLVKGYVPDAIEREGSLLTALTLKSFRGSDRLSVRAETFVDASYEGDLLAVSHVPYQVGRESRQTYNESHAGIVYAAYIPKSEGQKGWPKEASDGALNIRWNPSARGSPILPQSTGEADASVQAYNYRFILTNDPQNLVKIPKPANYDIDRYIGKTRLRSIVPDLPNQKIAWNNGDRLVGIQNGYPEGDWETREAIERQHLDYALGLLWYAFYDPRAPKDLQDQWKGWGLAKDEFADNNYIPYEIYVREARRLVGRFVFTQHDGVVKEGLERTPIHKDSVAITDWPMDSVQCTPNVLSPGITEGQLFLSKESRPSQVPYRCLLAKGVDNLLVPVCLSSSHVGFGCLRLEPVWVQTGEAAGWAAALANKYGVEPANLDPELLMIALAENRQYVSFFNDVDLNDSNLANIAANYFGTKGFFSGYNARLAEPLTTEVGMLWAEGFAKLNGGSLDPDLLAAKIRIAESTEGEVTGQSRGEVLEQMWIQRREFLER